MILAGWNNFQAMVTGFEVEKVEEQPIPEPAETEEITDVPLAIVQAEEPQLPELIIETDKTILPDNNETPDLPELSTQ